MYHTLKNPASTWMWAVLQSIQHQKHVSWGSFSGKSVLLGTDLERQLVPGRCSDSGWVWCRKQISSYILLCVTVCCDSKQDWLDSSGHFAGCEKTSWRITFTLVLVCVSQMFDCLYQALNSPEYAGSYSTISHWAGSVQALCGSFWAGSSCPHFYMGGQRGLEALNQTGGRTKTAADCTIYSLKSAV